MSSAPRSSVRKLTRVALCMEVLTDIERPGRFIQLVTSVPSRQGTHTRTWTLNGNGSMDAAAFTDLVAYIDQIVVEALSFAGGVSDRLPLE